MKYMSLVDGEGEKEELNCHALIILLHKHSVVSHHINICIVISKKNI